VKVQSKAGSQPLTLQLPVRWSDASESWRVQDNTLVIRRSKGGPFGLYNLLPWIHANVRWHIVSLTDDTLIVDGGPGTKQLVWIRSPTTPGRMP